MEFSVDMIRLVTRVQIGDFDLFNRQYLACNPSVNSYMKSRLQDYRYNFAVEETALYMQMTGENGGDYVPCNKFYFAYQHNQEQIKTSELTKYNLVIEFNPNKCDIACGLLNRILKKFFNDVHETKVVSADFCTDIEGVPIGNVMVDRGLKRTYIDYQSNNGRTLYVGKRGTNGQVKVYDKAAELGLKNKVLTRYECHLVFEDLFADMIMGRGFSISDCLPKVYFDSGQEKLDEELMEDVKLRCCVMAVKNGYANIKEFNRKYREKIMPYLENTAKVIIDNSVLKTIRETIITWFFWYCKVLNLRY